MSSSVMEAFKSLNVATAQDRSDHEAIFEVSYQYLAKVKDFNDLSAFHNCIVSLINSDKYYRAYQLIQEVPSDIHEQFPLEKAYVFYKIGHAEELEEVYSRATDVSNVTRRALNHVAAQSYYQNGRIQEALELYRELISSNSLDNELDMACNERAILSQGAFSEEPLAQVDDADITYDIVFNQGLIKLAQKDVSSSLLLLERASQMCSEQNMDSDPADLLLESAPIRLSIAYAHQVSGNRQRALQIMKDIDIANISDLMIRLIFKNNMATLSPQDDNLNFLSRELNLQHNMQQLRQKLTKAQYKVLSKNNLMLSYQSGTLSRSSSLFKNLALGDVTPLIFKILVKLDISLEDLNSNSKPVRRKVFKFAMEETSSVYGVAAALLMVHVSAKVQKYEQAILVLKKLTDLELEGDALNIHASPFGVLMNLYEIVDDSKGLAALYEKLIEKFQSVSPALLQESPQLYNFMRLVYFKLLAADKAPKFLIEKLSKAQPDDIIVSSTYSGDSTSLTSADKLASKVDVEELLEVNLDELIPQRKAPQAISQKAYKVRKASKPRFSKTKVLKTGADFDADKLDPERWLPMKLRSYYKPSRKEQKKNGLQGAVELSPAPAAPSSKAKLQKKKKKGKK